MNIETLISADFRGCIQAVRHGETIFEKAYGFADLANRIQNLQPLRPERCLWRPSAPEGLGHD